MRTQVDVSEVLADARLVLLDFDGPVCSIFAGHPAASIAAELRATLAAEGIQVPAAVAEQGDPLEVLRWTANRGDNDLTRRIDHDLTAAEVQASASADPTPHADDVLRASHETGRMVAIVSNNSAPAIETYTETHQLRPYVALVVGRDRAQPERMKPHPAPLLRAMNELDLPAASTVMIGDSASDILSAQAAGARSIGYANKPHKLANLTESGADATVDTMAKVASGLRYTFNIG